MRHFIDLVESAATVRRDPWGWLDAIRRGVSYDHSPLPSKVYHGTTGKRWRKTPRGVNALHVAIDRDVAVDFAQEWVEYDRATDPIVIEFELSELIALPSLSFGADVDFLELVDRLSEEKRIKIATEPTWRDSIDFYFGKFTIVGFRNTHKTLGKVTPLLPIRGGAG